MGWIKGLTSTYQIGKMASKTLAKGIGCEVLWQLTGQPDVLLGIIPIFTAQRYEVATSHEKMKYRAVAGQFFAHQRGGHVGFKVVLYLIGKESLDYLTYIQLLHAQGQASYDTITNKSKTGIVGLLDAGAGVKAGPGLGTKSFSKDDQSWQTIEKHPTFTIVTREEIMHGMYIETVLYERDVTLGDAIKVTILCRKYVKPLDIAYIQLVKNDDSGTIMSPAEAKGQMTSSGTWKNSTKKVIVGYSPEKAGLINAIGMTEKVLHRWYVNNLGDTWTDLEIARTVGGRLNSVLYGLNGKYPVFKASELIVDNIPKLRENWEKFWTNDVFGEHSRQNLIKAKLTNLNFYGDDGKSIVIHEPKDAKLLVELRNNKFYKLRIETPLGVYYATLSLYGGSLHMSCLSKDGYLPDSSSSSINTYLAPEDWSFVILLYRNSDRNYEVYRYNGTHSDGSAIETLMKIGRDFS